MAVRIALLGCGDHSRHHHAAPLAHFAKLHPDAVRLVGVCDLDSGKAEDFKHAYGFERAFTSLDWMLDEARPDAVVAVMPVPVISQVGAELLRRGVKCTVEKPLGSTPREVDALVEAAKVSGTPHMVSVNRRFTPAVTQGLQWAKERGPILRIHARMLRHRRTEPDFIWSTGIHVVDTVRYLAGDVVSWTPRLQTADASSGVRWLSLELAHDSLCLSHVEMFPTAGRVEERYTLYGSDFTVDVRVPVDIRGAESRLRCWEKGRLVVDETAKAQERAWMVNGAYQELEAFVHAVQTGEWPKAAIPDIAPSFHLCWSVWSSS